MARVPALGKILGGAFEFFPAQSNTGDYRDLRSAVDIARLDIDHITWFAAGSVNWGQLGTDQAIRIERGQTNTHLPDIVANATYRVAVLEDGTEWWCIRRGDRKRFAHSEWALAAGETKQLPQGSVTLIGRGSTSQGSGPVIVVATTQAIQLLAITDTIGITVS